MERPIFTFEATAVSKGSAEDVYGVLADLNTHLRWAGRESAKNFRLLEMNAPAGRALVGTKFTTTGADSAGTFRDVSTVTDATPGSGFGFDTDAHLDRKRGKPFEFRAVHRYDLSETDAGTQIRYTFRIERMNYRPYWLHPLFKPIAKMIGGGYTRKNLQRLARMAEEAEKQPD